MSNLKEHVVNQVLVCLKKKDETIVRLNNAINILIEAFYLDINDDWFVCHNCHNLVATNESQEFYDAFECGNCGITFCNSCGSNSRWEWEGMLNSENKDSIIVDMPGACGLCGLQMETK